MIRIYISPSCSSCRKVKEWFKEQEIPFETKSILSGQLTKNDIRDIIKKTLDGTDEIISKRSKVIKENNIDIDSMSFNELVDFIFENPSCLKRPIIVTDSRIQVGYNSEEIRSFIPKARRIFRENCSPDKCPDYYTCKDRIAREETETEEI